MSITSSTAREEAKIDRENINVLIGMLLTLVDATFQDKEQREAQKTIVRAKVWEWFGRYSEQPKVVLGASKKVEKNIF